MKESAIKEFNKKNQQDLETDSSSCAKIGEVSLNDLPNEILREEIFPNLGLPELKKLRTVSKRFKEHVDIYDIQAYTKRLKKYSVKQIAAGCGHSVVLLENGEVYVWGGNEYGQLGLGDTNDRHTPHKLTTLPTNAKVSQLFARGYHTLALLENGEVFAWGINIWGQLGLGDLTNRLTPQKITTLPEKFKVSQCVLGYGYTVALLENGEVFAWGRNTRGQLGLGDRKDRHTPQKVTTLPKNAKALKCAAGDFHTLFVLENGEVFTWGANDTGQLGLGDANDRHIPQKLSTLPKNAKVSQLFAGGCHTLALLDNGEMFAWGANHCGQLGLGDTDERLTPQKLTTLHKHAKVLQCLAGSVHCLARLENDEVFVWGHNGLGQLGLGDEDNRFTPQKLTTRPKNAKGLKCTAGDYHTLAIFDIDDIFVWGCNDHGELGLGDKKERLIPQKLNLSHFGLTPPLTFSNRQTARQQLTESLASNNGSLNESVAFDTSKPTTAQKKESFHQDTN